MKSGTIFLLFYGSFPSNDRVPDGKKIFTKLSLWMLLVFLSFGKGNMSRRCPNWILR